jgi:hypothetical protein
MFIGKTIWDARGSEKLWSGEKQLKSCPEIHG